MAISSVELVVTAEAGASYGQAAKECMILAVTEWRNVTLLFSGKRYKISPNDMLAAITEEKIMREGD